jgi:hypothetical protein
MQSGRGSVRSHFPSSIPGVRHGDTGDVLSFGVARRWCKRGMGGSFRGCGVGVKGDNRFDHPAGRTRTARATRVADARVSYIKNASRTAKCAKLRVRVVDGPPDGGVPAEPGRHKTGPYPKGGEASRGVGGPDPGPPDGGVPARPGRHTSDQIRVGKIRFAVAGGTAPTRRVWAGRIRGRDHLRWRRCAPGRYGIDPYAG